MLIIWGKIPLHSGGHLGVLSENGGEIALQVLLAKLAQWQSVAKAYHRVLTRMGRTDIKGTHWVRKTSATLANQITGDFYAVSRLLDHSSPDVTLKYVTPTNCEKQKVAEALNSVVSGFLKENARGENGHEDHDTPPAVPLRSLRGISQNLKLVKSTL